MEAFYAGVSGLKALATRRRSRFMTPSLGLLSHRLHSQVAMHQAYGGVVPELASRDHVRRLLPLVREALARGQVGQGIDRRGGLHRGTRPDRCAAGRRGVCLPAWPMPGASRCDGHSSFGGALLAPLLEREPPDFPFLALAGLRRPYPARRRGRASAGTGFWAKPWTMPRVRPSTRPRNSWACLIPEARRWRSWPRPGAAIASYSRGRCSTDRVWISVSVA
jgi:hypothetical protein